MKMLKSNIFVAALFLVLGVVGTLVIQRFSVREPSHAKTLRIAGSPDDAAGMNQLLDHFFDEDVFGRSSDPFEQMRRMRERMVKQFEQPGAPKTGSGFFDSWYKKRFGGGDVGEIQQREDEQFIYYDVAVKGLDKEKLDVRVGDGQINISGRMETKSGSGDSSAYLSSSFDRSFPVPADVDEKKVQIEKQQDKLVIKFPKLVSNK